MLKYCVARVQCFFRRNKFLVLRAIQNGKSNRFVGHYFARWSFSQRVKHQHSDLGLGRAKRDSSWKAPYCDDQVRALLHLSLMSACTVARLPRSALELGKDQRDCRATPQHRDDPNRAPFLLLPTPFVQRFRIRITTLGLVEQSQIVQRNCNIRMIGAKRLFRKCQ